MPRIARIIPDEGALHIIARRNNKRRLFRKEQDFEYMMCLIREYKMRYLCPILHYVLMPSHVHLIIKIVKKELISKMMHGVCMRHAAHYNKKYGLIGHFWQDRFKSRVITSEEDLFACGLYIEKNPVHAGLVDRPEDYKWTSYHFYAFGKKDDIVDMSAYYKSFSDDPKERQRMYRESMKVRILETLVS